MKNSESRIQSPVAQILSDKDVKSNRIGTTWRSSSGRLVESNAISPKGKSATPTRRHADTPTRFFIGICSSAALLLSPTLSQAGDILRPGVGPASPVTGGASAGSVPTSTSTQVRADAQSRLARTTQALQAVQSMQNAARSAAISAASSVPNGLVPGGLQVATGAKANWQGAKAPQQSVASGQTTVTIKQTTQQALLNWQTFNVGKNTTANFDQSAGGKSANTWVALNRVTDPTAQPSQILGSIKAPGQVYILNSNGIIFGGSSQINVGSLIAAAADSYLPPGAQQTSGDAYLLANGLYGKQPGGVYDPTFVSGPGSVIVNAGAQITTNTPQAVTSRGGSAILLGTSVQNNGSIVTPNGQTILAAGSDFVLRQGYSVATSGTGNTTSTTLGTEIEVDKGGAVTNNGLIEATTGDITLVGAQVTQAGVALATSSVSQRGTIHLLTPILDAKTGLADPTTSVTLASGSLTLIEPDPNSGTALNPQRAAAYTEGTAYSSDGGFNDEATLPDWIGLSRIEITTGGTVNFQQNSNTIANAGQISVRAGGRIFTATGSLLDVSGLTNVVLPMSANNLVVNVQGFELRDNPINRDTNRLANSTLYVDSRQLIDVPASSAYKTDRFYTPGGLLEVSGELNNVSHSINEWSTIGGSITLSANEVVTQSGSTFNLAGGSIAYQAGYLKQSWLIGSDGLLYNANTAPSYMTYTGVYAGFIVQHPRWNVTENFSSALTAPAQIWQPGYTVGRDAGNLLIYAPTSIFNGTVDAGTIAGERQNTARPSTVTDPFLLTQNTVPRNGSLSVGPYFVDPKATAIPAPSPYASNVVFSGGNTQPANKLSATGEVPASLDNINTFSASQISDSALGGLTVNVTSLALSATPNGTGTNTGSSGSPSESGPTTYGTVTISAPVTFGLGAQVSLSAVSADIGGNLVARSGNISINTLSAQSSSTPTTQSGVANFGITLEKNVIIDTRGLWTNALRNPTIVTGEAYVNGGNVGLVADQGINLSTGTLIDASSGGALLANAKTIQGVGGDIKIQADLTVKTVVDQPLIMAGTVRSNGFKKGGNLSLQAYSVIIGNPTKPITADQLVLPATFFDQGFSSYTVNGLTTLTVEPGTAIHAAEPVYQLTATSASVPTGTDPVAAFGSPVLLPTYTENPVTATLTQRPGVSLTLQSGINPADQPVLQQDGSYNGGAIGGSINVAKGTMIAVDPGQSVIMQSGGQITVEGIVSAPGGLIELVNHFALGISPASFDPMGRSIWLGSNSRLDVAGRAVTALDRFGRPYGVVPNGGTIVLGNEQILSGSFTNMPPTDAFVIIRPGALLDASGSSAVIDTSAGTAPTGTLENTTLQGGRVTVASNGGTIAMNSSDGIYIDGTIRAPGGGGGAAGGTLTLLLSTPTYVRNVSDPTNVDVQVPSNLRGARIIQIGQNALPSGLTAGIQPGQPDPTLVTGPAYLSVNALAQAGFGNISLAASDGIAFEGNVILSASQSITLNGQLADTAPNGRVTLSAPHVLLGNSIPKLGSVSTFTSGVLSLLINLASSPGLVTGAASLTINANLIDIQNQLFGISRSVPEPDGSTSTINDPAFAMVNFVSQGDIRFLGGSLTSPGSLSFTAAQLYPVSGVSETVAAGALQNSSTPFIEGTSISIGRIGSTDSVVPYSVFGQLSFQAETINQGGIVRAPLGLLSFGAAGSSTTEAVNFLSGSLTSVSAKYLTIPYGGTTDGVSYSVNGNAVTLTSLTSLVKGIAGPSLNSGQREGIAVLGYAASVEKGAILDLSGGGSLTGAGFISGRGGSVDVLSSALASANPTSTYSSVGNAIYAIVPGTQSYAPPTGGTSGAYSGGTPGVGQQISVPAGIPGLPAGTYTLMPSNYALLPGAYRVELGGNGNLNQLPAVSLANGSYQINTYTSIANTGIRSGLPTQAILSPGNVVRTYSQYDEESYSSFAVANAARFNIPRPFLPADAKSLALSLVTPQTAFSAVNFSGTTNFASGPGGVSGALIVSPMIVQSTGFTSGGQVEFTAPNEIATQGWVSITANAINAIGAPNIYVGGLIGLAGTLNAPPIASAITLRTGATLNGSQVVLTTSVGGSIMIESGASINTLAGGAPDLDSSNGLLFNNASNDINSPATFATLVVSNGYLNISPSSISGGGPITVEDGASLYSKGSIGFATTGSITLGEKVNYGAKYISFSGANIDLGTPAALAAAQQANILPPGLLLDQAVLSSLLKGNLAIGAPPLQMLTLSASQAINVFGTVDLNTVDPATGKSSLQEFVINSPAFYGSGGATDTATIRTGTLYWNGIAQQNNLSGGLLTYSDTPPGSIIPNGPGTGVGVLNIFADRVVFGYAPSDQPQNQAALGRLVAGFSSVNITATEEITANSKGTFSVYQTQTQPGTYTGGNLNIVTPLLTGGSGSVMTYQTGGTLTIASPSSAPGNVSAPAGLGAEINLAGNKISDSTSIIAASGKITFNSTGDIMFAAGSVIDVSGRTIQISDQSVSTFGGDIVVESAQGNILQAADSTFNVSAIGNDAGSLKMTATNSAGGRVLLAGLLLGSSTGNHVSGAFDVRAQNIGDFANINAKLDSGGFFGSRSFDIKQGDVTIGAGTTIKAHNVSISIDSGNLTVSGTIDASGATPGTIRLSAQDNFTLDGTGLLDAHGTNLQVDSYGQPITAKNKGVIELTAQQGRVTLAQNSTINLSSPDGVARGEVEINAPRTGETSGDIKISANGPLNIQGAASIAVNAFWKYSPTDAQGTIVQDNGGLSPIGSNGSIGLNQINQSSQTFINAALVNGNLQQRLAGLKAYGHAFHLRPGVEIDSGTPTGNLTVSGDLDLSGFRYGPNVNPSLPGSGEPGVLILRAGGTLAINGSINDGFSAPPSTPDDNQFIILAAGTLHFNKTLPADLPPGTQLLAGTSFTPGSSLDYSVDILAGTLPANTQALQQYVLAQSYTIAPNNPLPLNYTTPSDLILNIGQQAPFGFTNSKSVTLATSWTPNQDVILNIGNGGNGVTYGPDQPPGFTTVPAGTVIPSGTMFQQGIIFPQTFTIPAGTLVNAFNTSLIPITYQAGTIIPQGSTLPDTVAIQGGPSLLAHVAIPTQVTLSQSYTLTSNLVATGTIVTPTTTYVSGDTIPAGTILTVETTIGAGTVLPFSAQIDSMTWPAGTPLVFTSSVTAFDATNVNPGQIVPAGTVLPTGTSIVDTNQTPGKIWAISQMLPSGTQSWSLRLVGGSDLASADTRTLQARSALNGSGGLVLYDPHISAQNTSSAIAIPSVIRTGTGYLDLLAGGSFSEDSLYGIYTAGTQSANVSPAFNLPRGAQSDGSGTVLGSLYSDPINNPSQDYASAIANYQAYYPDGGGNVFLSAQGDIRTYDNSGYGGLTIPTYSVSNWLWRQGGAGLNQQGAWWINFGTYASQNQAPTFVGFTGIGALAGGNVTILAGGNAGTLVQSPDGSAGDSLVAAVGATGRVNPDGTLTETGGGDLTIKIGESLNPVQSVLGGTTTNNGLAGGELTNIRGDIKLQAGSIGGIQLVYGQSNSTDPRPTASSSASIYSFAYGGPVIVPGDGSASLRARGDLVLGNAADPGRVTEINTTAASVGPQTGNGESWFTLWTASTGIEAFSSGGNIVPIITLGTAVGIGFDGAPESVALNSVLSNNSYLFPPILKIEATQGSVYFGSGTIGAIPGGGSSALELAPSPNGYLEMLAQGSIYANALSSSTTLTAPLILDVSGANSDRSSIPNPFNPAFYLYDPTSVTFATINILAYNTNLNGSTTVTVVPNGSQPPGLTVTANPGILPLFAFGPDTATGTLHAGDSNVTRIYAATGDIVDVQLGEFRTVVNQTTTGTTNSATWFVGGEQAQIRAGADIVNFGQPASLVSPKYPSLIVNNLPSDVSVLSAGQDIIYANVDVAGPGTLEVSAGRNVYQGGLGVLESLGPVANKAQNPTGGADITVLAGVGSSGPNWTGFANLYLNSANLADPTGLLVNQPGKVVQTYQDQLDSWLRNRFAYNGTKANELTYFKSLPVEQQSVFLLQVYFDELNQSGLEHNDPTSRFSQSYVRGNEAIATLFPVVDASGKKTNYKGDLTLFSQNVQVVDSNGNPATAFVDSSILTDFGGSITTLTPGGQVIVGTTGGTPGAHAGILTQGTGDIDMYSHGSVLLGQSRILTTFGGSIVIWSATGDINAGRGSKGTVIFTPPGINYDNFADITLAPTVPSSGAGIGTLAPIPGVPPGNLNLVAPLGTIDAGEAGLRSSGNANLAALTIVNAANISVQGKTTGVPLVAAPNVAAETAASTAAGSATSAANEVAKQQAGAQQQQIPSIITVEVLGYGGS
jgi:filamentous hemagglutinin family protein